MTPRPERSPYDLADTGDSYQLTAELPGMIDKDKKATAQKRTIAIKD